MTRLFKIEGTSPARDSFSDPPTNEKRLKSRGGQRSNCRTIAAAWKRLPVSTPGVSAVAKPRADRKVKGLPKQKLLIDRRLPFVQLSLSLSVPVLYVLVQK